MQRLWSYPAPTGHVHVIGILQLEYLGGIGADRERPFPTDRFAALGDAERLRHRGQSTVLCARWADGGVGAAQQRRLQYVHGRAISPEQLVETVPAVADLHNSLLTVRTSLLSS